MTYTSTFTNKNGETRRSDRLAKDTIHEKVKAIAPAMMQRA